MRVHYIFATGKNVEVEVEVSPEIEAYINESNRLEDNSDRKHRRHDYSSDACIYEGLAFTNTVTPESFLLDKEFSQHIKETLEKLTETQRRRLLMIADGYNALEISKIEKVHPSVIYESLESARKKFIKNF